jgi:transposase InsO family protein
MTIEQKLIQNKLGLINLAEELGNISQACKVMGFSRDSFYRYRQLLADEGPEGLRERTRRKPNLANRVESHVEQAALKKSFEFPCYGKDRISDQLKLDGIMISGSTVRNIWIRHKLQTLQDRLKWLEQKAQQEGILLTEEQKIALEKKQEDLIAYGEIETAHPGYLGSQDSFYIGYLKGVGRIYQQTFVDTYSKVAICKLYTAKNSLVAADLLNDLVVPFFDQYESRMLRILTDRGSEYCGNIETHSFQLFLALNEIEHTKTKAYHPQTNGICERFHRTILNEFYRVTFRKKVYQTLDELQDDLDQWLEFYNNQRTHQGKMCCGRTPMNTFLDGLAQWKQKQSELGIELN